MDAILKTLTPLLVVIALAATFRSQAIERSRSPQSPSSSYAILARDPITGEYGVAAASHAPLIGINLEFIDPDVGGVVVLGGPHLELNATVLSVLAEGMPTGTAVAVGLVADSDKEHRQVLAVGPNGAAAFTGKKLRKHARDKVGDYFVAAGHRLADDDVVDAMAAAFSSYDGNLTNALLHALQAGKAAGGEEDGEHSAALLVVGPGARFATRERLVDLRIDFVPEDAVGALVDLRARVDSVYEVLR
jgi:uncharacterized Ntn-hydrolase superfamily protein